MTSDTEVPSKGGNPLGPIKPESQPGVFKVGDEYARTPLVTDEQIKDLPNAIVKLSSGIKVLDDGLEHSGRFYFKRAFLTAFAILTAVSVFIAAWVLIWTLIIGGLWGLGQSTEPDGPTNEPSSDFSLSCDPPEAC